jgi:hypothetical protein
MQAIKTTKILCIGLMVILAALALGSVSFAAKSRTSTKLPALRKKPVKTIALPKSAINYVVAVNGNDDAPGTLIAPFATLERARDEIRKLKTAGSLDKPVNVYIRGGIYELKQAFSLSKDDSGTTQTPITYRAYGNEKPVIIGGRTITGWQPYKGNIVKADVSSQGFKDIYFRQLFFNGKRQILARYPNYDQNNPVAGGWLYQDGDKVPMYKDIENESFRTFIYKPEDRRDWAHTDEVEVMIFPRYNWWNNIIRIASIDRDTRTVTLAGDASFGNRYNDRYYYRNALEELDALGEWYLDNRTWTLYFWPPSDIAKGTVYAPSLQTLLDIKEASNITFRGLTLECADGTSIILTNCNNCLIAGNVVRNVSSHSGGGESAIAINGGKNNGVAGNDISEVGDNAISVNGGDFNTLEPAGNYADNNYIHHVGIYYKQGVGVTVSGVGNRVSHNLIHDCPRFGIVWGGNDHIFEYNEIRHCTLETADTGAIYSWQVDWSKRGTIMRYNYLHDIIGFGQENGKWTYPTMNWGFYLDDGTCGVHLYGNIVARTILGGVHYHGGRDNIVENNILIDGRDSQVQFSGYVKGGHPVPMMTDTWNKYHGTEAYNKYPGYAELTKSLEDAWQMAGNTFTRNIVAYSNPKAKMYAYYNLPFDKTDADYNLIWHKKLPILTGTSGITGTTGPNLAVNAGFEDGKPGEMPTDWSWQIQPEGSKAEIDSRVFHSGKQSLRVEGHGTVTDASGQVLTPSVMSIEIPVIPGKSYKLSTFAKSSEPSIGFSMLAQSYRPNVAYWWGKGISDNAGTEWKECQAVFTFPAPGDSDYNPEMKIIRIRIDITKDKGIVWFDDIKLQEAKIMNEWDAWKALGLDKHSVIADPKFVNAAKDDYRLKPNSPAFKLGFKQIPVEKIGPYKNELRATWPIKQAVGVRETMKIDWSGENKPPAPPRNTTPFVVKKTTAPIVIDGVVSPGEWPEAQMILKQDPGRMPISSAPCTATACHDDTNLYFTVTVPIKDSKKLKLGSAWGTDDGAEVCFQDVSSVSSGPVFVLHSFASGKFESSTEAGAPDNPVKKLGSAVKYTARVSATQWTGEWSIPLSAAGIQYKPGLKLAFNTGVNRTQTSEWIIWVGALAQTWNMSEAGYLVLE